MYQRGGAEAASFGDEGEGGLGGLAGCDAWEEFGEGFQFGDAEGLPEGAGGIAAHDEDGVGMVLGDVVAGLGGQGLGGGFGVGAFEGRREDGAFREGGLAAGLGMEAAADDEPGFEFGAGGRGLRREGEEAGPVGEEAGGSGQGGQRGEAGEGGGPGGEVFVGGGVGDGDAG